LFFVGQMPWNKWMPEQLLLIISRKFLWVNGVNNASMH
jgi:hypothetical protein